MPENDQVETQRGPAFDFTEALVSAYVNPGPYFDKIEGKEDKIFENAITEIVALEIHSSIDGFYRYGYIVIPDRIGFRETLSLTGNEIISVRYSNSLTSQSFSPKVVHFNIYDMEEVSLKDANRDNFTNKLIKLHLIEAPFFLLFNQNTWSRAFGKDTGNIENGEKINNIFEKHITNDLNLNDKLIKLDFNDMSTKLHWLIPSWKPQKTFSYLLKFARDEKGFGNVKFYTTTELNTGIIILNLKSIAQMFSSKEVTSYTVINTGPFNQSALNEQEISQKSLDYLFEVKFLSYDITSLTTGLGGASILSRDYERGEYTIYTDDYITSNNKEKYFGQFGLWSDSISTWQTGQLSIGTYPEETMRSYLNNRIIDQKYQLRCVAKTYFNHIRNCGDKVSIVFPSASSSVDETRTIDEQMSGDWIIQEIVDYYANGRAYSEIYFIKDSFHNTVRGTTEQKLPSVTPITPSSLNIRPNTRLGES